jgi:phosphohistidine phosphatase
MVTLSLFRHAKSAWDNTALDDFERPLAARGEQAALRMGQYMAEYGLEPELVLCSTAVRARQTLELAAAEWASTPVLRYEDELYHASPADMMSLLNKLPQSCMHAMVIGHNPGIHLLAVKLCDDGGPEALRNLGAKFPTAALARIAFDGSWSEVQLGAGRLLGLIMPRELGQASRPSSQS